MIASYLLVADFDRAVDHNTYNERSMVNPRIDWRYYFHCTLWKRNFRQYNYIGENYDTREQLFNGRIYGAMLFPLC